jgi:hypothetical protein
MLAQTVGNFTNGGPPFGGVNIMCHGATLYWLYTDEFGSPPSMNVFTSNSLSPPDPVIKSMLPLGKQVLNSMALKALPAGTVIVFVENGSPKHSCVTLNGKMIGGYNQTGWFTSPGTGGHYSTHSMDDVQWLSGMMSHNQVQGSNASMKCKLIAIPENTAKAVVRRAIQG